MNGYLKGIALALFCTTLLAGTTGCAPKPQNTPSSSTSESKAPAVPASVSSSDAISSAGAPASGAASSRGGKQTAASPSSAASQAGNTGAALRYSALSQTYSALATANPLKGFIPFKGTYNTIDYSMEWFYLPLSKLMNGEDSYTFDAGLEPVLKEIAGRGHQACFRIYLDYPSDGLGAKAVPDFIWNMGVKKYAYTAYGGGVSPDYTNQRLIDVLDKFIRALGKRYDGDPRIAYITCGLIGHWGEWHTYPDNSPMPSNAQINQLFKAFDEAFSQTKLLTRYADSAGASSFALGFHDDSFTESTIGDTSWYFQPRIDKVSATDKWKTEVIGGEFRPEFQSPFLLGTPSASAQDYTECVKETHCTWLIMNNAFTGTLTAAQKKTARTASNQLGYDYYVTDTSASGNQISVTIRNKGVAPFYYAWKVNLALAQNGAIRQQSPASWDISGILPGADKAFSSNLDTAKAGPGEYTLVMQVVNPLEKGVPFRFANGAQDADVNGWLSLGTVTVS